MPVEHEERALPPRVSHEARHAGLGRDARRHARVARHQVPLYCLDPPPLAWPPGDPPEALAALVVDGPSPMLWAKRDAVLARPLGVREAVGPLRHGALLPPAAGDPSSRHPRGEGVSLHSVSAIHPLSGWLSVPRRARHRLKP
jgi:hypothetical protein